MSKIWNHLFLVSLILVSTSSLAYEDFDMDGVDDMVDKCPNTSFSDLVDIRGCAIKSLDSPLHYDVIVGMSYADADYQTLTKADTFATSIQADYYYRDFSFQASTSYFTTNSNDYSDRGFYDSFLGATYKWNLTDALFTSIGVGVILPTYSDSLNNNNTDYRISANVSYSMKNINIFGAYTYTLINDDDIIGMATYQNTRALGGGVGYYVDNSLYVSASYNVSNSVYSEVGDIKTASIYANYTIDEHWFGMLSYARGLSDSASKNYLSLRLGYYF
jgi:hypothetical protein